VIVWLVSVVGMQPLSAVCADEGLVVHYTFNGGPGGVGSDEMSGDSTQALVSILEAPS
jgi:hypothetical protein